MPRSAIVIDKKDNVATALKLLKAGDSIHVDIENDEVDIILPQEIQIGHKFAIRDIIKGQSVIKYGETIGLATDKIPQGWHVHVHNVEGTRGRGDKQ